MGYQRNFLETFFFQGYQLCWDCQELTPNGKTLLLLSILKYHMAGNVDVEFNLTL